ncbi:sodium-independent anion transporter, partial [Mesorhizobium japonicum]|uniref:sodium-independent anion transporter n=1 Tax=Mesorhizobium japonicum TaxID=2066070 RepID=UPI003B59E9D3
HEEQRLLDEHIVAYRIDGPLFFGAAQRFLHELSEVTDVAVLILRLGRVSTLDVTGVRMLGEVVRSLERRGTAVLLSGLRPGHSRMLMSSPSLVGLVAEERVFDTTPEAIAAARRIVAVARG